MRQLYIYLLISFIFFNTADGGINFSVTTDKTEAVVGEQATITAKVVSDKDLKKITKPSLSSSEYFDHIRTGSDQHQSTSIQIINGKMSQKKEITYLFYYFISFKKEGSFTFPSLTFKYGGQSYSSKPFQISVGKEQTGKKVSSGISVSVRTNKRSMYVGEQVILTVNIAKKADAPLDLTNEGFVTIIEKIEETLGKNFSINKLFTNKIAQTQRNINGQIHHVFSLSFSIIPLKPGNYTLSPIPFEYQELQRVRGRRDIFDDFFGGRFFGGSVRKIPRTTYSNRVSLNVLALPPQPAGFSGAVGSFSIDAQISESTVPVGGAVTLRIDMKGNTRPGNMTDIKLPDLLDFEVFTPEKHVYIDTSSAGISTRKKLKYLIIPKEEGEKTLPSIKWIYFDPVKGVYKTIATKPISLTVTKGEKGTKQQLRYLTKEDIREIGRDIRYIKTATKLKHQSTEPYKNPLFFILFPVPFLIALFSLLYRIQANVLRKAPSIRLRKLALHTAKEAIKRLKKDFSTSIPVNAVSRTSEIIENYISHRFGFAASGKTLEELKEELSKLNVKRSITDALVPLLEKLDSYRFGRSTTDKQTLSEIIKKTEKLIEELEKEENKS